MATKTAPKTAETSDPLRYKRGISFNIYLPSSELYLKDELEVLAKKDNRSVSEFVIAILKKAVDK
jgi:hypothetical protein